MKIIQIGKATLINGDCMEYMSTLQDKAFDLAVVDPPYGIKFGEFNRTNKTSSGVRSKADKYKNSDWDNEIPSDNYFNNLISVSTNQIIWGGNYFPYLWYSGCKGFVFWYKKNPVDNFSDGELAYTSFNKPAKCFEYPYYGNIEGSTSAGQKIHPTQKPVKLYEWIYANYAKPGQRILDTHGGSMSSVIAALNLGFEIVCIEKDEEYFNAAADRVIKSQQQQRMF